MKKPSQQKHHPTPASRHWSSHWILPAILILAAGLRLYHLDQLPPGLHVDETPNAWNAYCLLKAGTDQHGAAWPVFYLRAFGENRSTFFAYALIPFQALGGMNVWTTRLPGALGGILTVLLIYWLGSRLFGRPIGMAAAALLALNPWHLQQCRWGHEASLVPLLILAPICCMVWANLPPADPCAGRPRWMLAALAGALAGVACYGYPAVRVFLPCLLVLSVPANWRIWRQILKNKNGWQAAAGFLLLFLLFFGPLAWKHWNDPAMNKRAQTTWGWEQTDTFPQKALKVLERYPGHFGPDFLFLHGDNDVALSPPNGIGLFLWDSLAWMLLGVAYLILTWRSSPQSRFLVIWILSYPAGDLLSRHASMHALRSLPGVCALVFLAALGGFSAWRWAMPRFPAITRASLVVVGLIVIGLNIDFLSRYFSSLYASPEKQQVFYMEDLLEASRWLKPHLNSVERVYCTSSAMAHPYIYTLIGMDYDPRQWFLDSPRIVLGPLPNGSYANEEECLAFGKMRFAGDASYLQDLQQLRADGGKHRIVFIVRPGELGLEKKTQATRIIADRFGNPSLLIFEVQI